MGEGSGVVSALAKRGLLPGSFVVHLGSNGPATASDVTNIIEAAQGRPIVLVTVRVPRRWDPSGCSLTPLLRLRRLRSGAPAGASPQTPSP